MHTRMPLRGLAAAALAVITLGCDASEGGAPNPSPALAVIGAPAPVRGSFVVCKDGTDAGFSWTVNGAAQAPFSLTAGDCQTIYAVGGSFRTVDVTEQVPANTTLDSVTIAQIYGPTADPVGTTTTSTVSGPTASGRVGLEWGTVMVFYNRENPPPPPPGGGEGCTPGYWKQPHHFDSWTAPYTPNTLFSDVFENAFPGMTLVQVAAQGGGGIKALGRHTIAALLNAASSGVSYDLTAQDVITRFNAAYPGGDYNGLKDVFEGFNEQGCPLN